MSFRAPGALPRLRCIECNGQVKTEWRDYAFEYGARKPLVELTARLPVEICVSCGAGSYGPEAAELKHDAVCRHHGVLTPREIRALRKGHGLSRADFASLTGLGQASLHRWENGILIQNPANDRYLRLLQSAGAIRVLQELAAGGEKRWKPVFRLIADDDARRAEPAAYQLRAA